MWTFYCSSKKVIDLPTKINFSYYVMQRVPKESIFDLTFTSKCIKVHTFNSNQINNEPEKNSLAYYLDNFILLFFFFGNRCFKQNIII